MLVQSASIDSGKRRRTCVRWRYSGSVRSPRGSRVHGRGAGGFPLHRRTGADAGEGTAWAGSYLPADVTSLRDRGHHSSNQGLTAGKSYVAPPRAITKIATTST